MRSLKTSRIVSNTIIYIILGISAVIWVLPILWLLLQSFGLNSAASSSFVPKDLTWANYYYLIA